MANSRADVLGRIACIARIRMVRNPSRDVLNSSKRRWRKHRKKRAGFCGGVYVPRATDVCTSAVALMGPTFCLNFLHTENPLELAGEETPEVVRTLNPKYGTLLS